MIDSFQAGCGLHGPIALVVSGPGRAPSAEPIVFDRPFVVIGRSESSCLQLDDDSVSYRHAYLQAVAGRVFCIDLGSLNGISWEGKKRRRGWLKADEPFQIGPYSLSLSPPPTIDVLPPVPACDWDPLEERVADPELLPAVHVKVTGRGQALKSWRMNRVMGLVGSSRGCRLRLRDRDVSHFHCCLVGTPRGIWVIDLSSRTGTWMKGQPTKQALLADGDTVQVGDYELRFRYGARRPADRQRLTTKTQQPTEAGGPLLVPAGIPPGQPPSLPDAEAANADDLHGDAGIPPLFAPILKQMQMMQQQMYDQFQQILRGVARLLVTMTKEQTAEMRKQLEPIQRAIVGLQEVTEKMRQPPAASSAGTVEMAAVEETLFDTKHQGHK